MFNKRPRCYESSGSGGGGSEGGEGEEGGGGAMGIASFASSMASVFSSLQEASAARAVSNFNASIIDNQLPWIDMQIDISREQYARKRNKLISSGTAQLGASGLNFSGSPLAVMLDALTQIEIDDAITTSNLKMDKIRVHAQAEMTRAGGRRDYGAAKTNAFSKALQGGSDYALYKYGTRGNKNNTTKGKKD